MIKEFAYSSAERGQEVTPETYDHFLNVLPPIRLKGGQPTSNGNLVFGGFQVSEAYSDYKDKTGNYRPVYATFVSRDGRYFFEGFNFRGEVDSETFGEFPFIVFDNARV